MLYENVWFCTCRCAQPAYSVDPCVVQWCGRESCWTVRKSWIFRVGHYRVPQRWLPEHAALKCNVSLMTARLVSWAPASPMRPVSVFEHRLTLQRLCLQPDHLHSARVDTVCVQHRSSATVFRNCVWHRWWMIGGCDRRATKPAFTKVALQVTSPMRQRVTPGSFFLFTFQCDLEWRCIVGKLWYCWKIWHGDGSENGLKQCNSNKCQGSPGGIIQFCYHRNK